MKASEPKEGDILTRLYSEVFSYPTIMGLDSTCDIELFPKPPKGLKYRVIELEKPPIFMQVKVERVEDESE